MPTVNIATHLKDMARRRPEQLAVMFPAGRDSAGRTAYTSLTFQRLDEDSDHIAAGLTAMGIGRGERTVLMVPPSLEFFSLTFALFKAGAVPVFVDPGMGLKNIGTCLGEAQPVGFIGVTKAHVARWLFGWGQGTLTKFVSLRGHRTRSISINKTSMTLRDLTIIGRGICESPAPRAVETAGLAPGMHDLESIVPPSNRIAETAASDMAAILFTSGSTGVPKGAVYSHGNFVAQVELLRDVFGIEPGEIDLCTFPLFALFASALGMTAIIPRMDFTRPARVNPREVIEPIQRFGATNMFGSPALLNAVGRYASRRIDGLVQETMPTLKRVLSAGAPVSAEIIGRFQATLSAGAQVFTPYGATEALPVAVIGSREVLDETRQQTAQGAGTCVGRPVEGVQVSIIRITDEPIPEWSDSLLLPPGEIGEIVVRGPQVTSGYFNRPDLTALAKIGEPSTGQIRHRMGDLGYFDEQGRLWFCGRKSHRVVTPERTFFTEPLEGIFNAHPQVFRTALVGVMRGGAMQPVLCVELEAEAHRASKSTLTEELLALGAKHETSRRIQTILFHDAFPVDIRHNSKIFREKLAVWAAKRMK
ncbi:MAG: AMP-binding protein [Candidatus Saccharimonas sp.]|nr:AMP-binding protein [Planctomycetaceae bacterium]